MIFDINPQWNAVAYLKKLHTRQIMSLRKDAFSYGRGVIWVDMLRRNLVTLDQIKDELALREHIPNKKEAKEIRKAKAKFQRS